jgi:hypothetical protein
MMESIDKAVKVSIPGIGKGSNASSNASDDEDGMNFADVFDEFQREESISNHKDRKSKEKRDYLMLLMAEDIVNSDVTKESLCHKGDGSATSRVISNGHMDEEKSINESIEDETKDIDEKDDIDQLWSNQIDSQSDTTHGKESEGNDGEQELGLSSSLQPANVISGISSDNPFDLLSMTEMMDPDLRIESSPQQIISRIAQSSGNHGPMSEKLADVVFPQVIRSFATLVRGENAEMRLKLQPGDLGEIELRIRTTEAVVRGEMMVQNPEVKALLEKHMERLRAALADEGLELAGFDVDLGDEGSAEKNMDEKEQHPDSYSTRRVNSMTEDLVIQTTPSSAAIPGDNDLDITA